MDAYFVYNQIKMYLPDQENTTFITEAANCCYKVMPFSPKNAGATYQRLMDKVFKEKIDINVEVYVDDMVVKSATPDQHAKDLVKIFTELRKHNMRLNPKKYTLGSTKVNSWVLC